MRRGAVRGRYDRDKKIPEDKTPREKLIESTKSLLWGEEKGIAFPTTRAGWYRFTINHFPIPIPEHKICKDHDTPLDFFYKFVTGKLDHLINIILCSRGSYKTFSMALGSATKMIYQPGCKILYMAGIEDQTDQGYEYFREFWNGFAYTENYLDPKKDIQIGNTYLKNGSRIHFGAFTEAMANSKRWPVVIVDEVDSVKPFLRRTLVEDLISVPDRIYGIQPAIIFTSSMRDFGGTMAWLMEKNGKIEEWLDRGICKLWLWCYKETTEQCNKHIGKCEDYFEKATHLAELQDIGELRDIRQDRNYINLKASVRKMERDCPLVITCHGDLHKAPDPIKPGALRSLWDKGGLIDKIKGLSKKAIKAQYDCVLPKELGKLYDEEILLKRVVPGLEYRTDSKYENYLLIDWGFSHATAVILLQRDLETNMDYAIKCWRWVRRNPNWRVDQVKEIYKNHNFPNVRADAEDANMNKLLEDEGIEVVKVPFGISSGYSRDKSKLAYAIGILEKRLEMELIEFSEEECEPVVTCLRSLLDKPKGGNRFGVEDDHYASALWTLYADENPEILQDMRPKIAQTQEVQVKQTKTFDERPILVTTPKYPDPFEMEKF